MYEKQNRADDKTTILRLRVWDNDGTIKRNRQQKRRKRWQF